MVSEGNSGLHKEVRDDLPEQNQGVKELVETLIQSFLRSDSDYGAITDINTDVDYVYNIVRSYISQEKLDVYALKLEERILLSRTNLGFEELLEVIKNNSELYLKQNMIEIWDDPKNRILHLIITPFRKHFPVEYSSEKEKMKLVGEFSQVTLQPSE